MANALDMDLTDKVVLVGTEWLKPEYHDDDKRRFLCEGGFGCQPYTLGKAIFGRYLHDGEECRIEGYMVEKIADDQSVPEAKVVDDPMVEYRFTFGIQYAQDPHPNCSWVHPDGWLTVLAPSRDAARVMASGIIGHVEGPNSPIAYAFEYDEEEWSKVGTRRGSSWDETYPKGELARISFEVWE